MTARTAKRAATVAALTFIAAFGLSACGGSSNGISDGAYVPRDDATADSSVTEALVFADGEVSQVEYIGSQSGATDSVAEQCDAYKRFIGDAEDGSINPEGVKGSYKVKATGPINDDGDTVVWEDSDPEPIAVDTPDTDMLTIGDEIYVPSSDDGAQDGIKHAQDLACDEG